jgi:hypothetical protein
MMHDYGVKGAHNNYYALILTQVHGSTSLNYRFKKKKNSQIIAGQGELTH